MKKRMWQSRRKGGKGVLGTSTEREWARGRIRVGFVFRWKRDGKAEDEIERD